jgi:hypothetical protein
MFVKRAVLCMCCAIVIASPASRAAGKDKAAAGAAAQASAAGDTADRAKVLRAAADALGMVRWSDIGGGGTRLPGIDVINTMEFSGTGVSYTGGQPAQTEFRVELAYNPPGMRVQTARGGAPSIQTVRENYAWDESEPGAGLIPGKGTATAQMSAAKERILQLWILPYGVVKAAIAAGDKTVVSKENGATVLAFPLGGAVAGVTVRATLDANNLITKVETKSDNPALNTESEYSDYADHGEIATDIKSPAHIVRKQGGRPVMDLQVKTWDANNPYVVFPVPSTVKTGNAKTAARRAGGDTRLAADESAGSR